MTYMQLLGSVSGGRGLGTPTHVMAPVLFVAAVVVFVLAIRLLRQEDADARPWEDEEPAEPA
jgi:hypothetical protein